MEKEKTAEKRRYQVGKNIRHLRELKGYSPKEMADKLDISVSGYTRIEREDVTLTSDRAIQIAEILNVSPGLFYEFDSEKVVFNQNNSDHAIGYVNNYAAPEELIKAKDEVIESLKKQLAVFEHILKRENFL